MEDKLVSAIQDNLSKGRFVPEHAIVYDVVFVLNVNSRGWILEKICRVIAGASNLQCGFVYTERNDTITQLLPAARAYFFSHYALFISAMQKNRSVASAMRFVWFTHPNPEGAYTYDDVARALNFATAVFTANSIHRRELIEKGVAADKIHTVLGGADETQFTAKTRKGKTVAFVGAYYERKNPQLMHDVVAAMPDVRFLLLAPSEDEVENRELLWASWPIYAKLKRLANLEIIEAPYTEFPRLFDSVDVYCSLSKLEGGPIPLIEALFANCMAVVTRTGFAEDVILEGANGSILELDAGVKTVEAHLRRALSDKRTDVRTPALDYSWSAFGRGVARIMMPPIEDAKEVSFADMDTCRRYLREGWSAKEDKGCMIGADRARIVLPRAKSDAPPKSIELRLRLKAHGARPFRDIGVWLNGFLVHRARLPTDSVVHTLKVDIPRHVGVLDEGDEVGSQNLWIGHCDDAAAAENRHLRIEQLRIQ